MGEKDVSSLQALKISIIRPAQPLPSWFVPTSQAPEGAERGEGHGQPCRRAFPWEKQGGTVAGGPDGLWLCGMHKTSVRTPVMWALKGLTSIN